MKRATTKDAQDWTEHRKTRCGNVCCLDDQVKTGSFDQRPVESRQDVLVYTGEPLTEDLEVTGGIEVVLFVSSDARDTDFTAKLVDVEPDGTAWNLDETIKRVRYREGFDREVLMESGTVYELRFAPLMTSNVFRAGHRIRLEVSSSNYPRFARNLNTGGWNPDETGHAVATNSVHHGPGQASYVLLTTLDRGLIGGATVSSLPRHRGAPRPKARKSRSLGLP